jgi:hypothetical protein
LFAFSLAEISFDFIRQKHEEDMNKFLTLCLLLAATVSLRAQDDDEQNTLYDEADTEDCEPDNMAFELITGYSLSAQSKMLDSLPGTLMLSDCLEACHNNFSCLSVNYETGLCVLFSTTAEKMEGEFETYSGFHKKESNVIFE